MTENDTVSPCPKCGEPRLRYAWDCVRCGTVFDAGVAERPADDASSGEQRPAAVTPRNLSSGKIAATNGRTISFREWIDQNIAVAVFLAVVLFAATLWMFHRVAGNSTDSPGAVEAAYREVVGRFPPKGFEAGFSGHFVGREVVVLEHSDGLMLYVYFHRWPARRLAPADLDAGVEKVLEFFDMEWTEVRRGTVEQGDEVVMGRVLLLGDSQGPHLYLLPIHTAGGEPAMLALLGPQVEARAMAREIIERL